MIYEFSPRQAFNGYDKPWAPGANYNQWDPDTSVPGYVGANGAMYQPNSLFKEITSDFVEIPEDATSVIVIYEGYTPGESLWIACAFYDEDKTFMRRFALSSGTSPILRVELSGNPRYMRGICRTYGHGNKNAYITFSDISAFSPYANICPPIGYDIYDPETGSPVEVYAGYVNDVTRELFLRPVYEEYAGETLVGPWVSSMDEYTEGGTPTEGTFVVDLGGAVTRYEITDFQLQSLLSSLGIRIFFKNGASLLNSLMYQAQGRVRSQFGLHVHAIGPALPAGLTFKPIPTI